MTETKDKIKEIEMLAMNIVFQIGDALGEGLKKKKDFVLARQNTNDDCIDFVMNLIAESNREAYKKGVKDFAKYLQDQIEPMKFAQNGVGYYRNKFLESLKDTGKEEE